MVSSSGQTTFNSDHAQDLLNQLESLYSDIKVLLSTMNNHWSHLSDQWHDSLHNDFAEFYSALAGAYQKSQVDHEEQIAKLREQIRIAQERQQKLSALK
ncbi:hypothetical protein [Leptothoe spongobia]|uniref:Uncharacterized protein n=1 Tax=Leptothoe spongobia TAU-MAC 1115 TaxID=1967444 RepID=A0A947DHJ6_9CYAN|nr:hypothetical protein [Leptothoe spongobia]MBT9317056.1 hypothetical protein [Leptothoe spongobia TAU-MAC 1115]